MRVDLGTREQFIARELAKLLQERAARMKAIKERIEAEFRPSKQLPVGASRVQALLTAKRLSFEEKQLRTAWRVAQANLDADTRCNEMHWGRVWDRLMASEVSP